MKRLIERLKQRLKGRPAAPPRRIYGYESAWPEALPIPTDSTRRSHDEETDKTEAR